MLVTLAVERDKTAGRLENVGADVGIIVGALVGVNVGADVGINVGADVGINVGADVEEDTDHFLNHFK